jgi:lysophospholipase L1-like esterase
MARSRTTAKIVALVLSAAVCGTPALSQSAAPAPAPIGPTPFSKDCQFGDNPIVAESPLPNVAAALKNRKQVRILTIGSSSVSGRRLNHGGYADQIRDILSQAQKGIDIVMINRGVSGELAANAAIRLRTEVALNEPDLVLWQVGTNDALAYVPLDQIETAVVDTVLWLKEHKVDVVLAGLQYTSRMAQDANYRAVRELMRRIAAQQKVMIVRRYEAQQLIAQATARGSALEPDEFPHDSTGYSCLAQYVARAITLGIFAPALRPRELQSRPPVPKPPAN